MDVVSDKVGRRPVLITFTVLAMLTACPIMCGLIATPILYRRDGTVLIRERSVTAA